MTIIEGNFNTPHKQLQANIQPVVESIGINLQTGAKGEKGEKGDQGVQGPTGMQGIPGNNSTDIDGGYF